MKPAGTKALVRAARRVGVIDSRVLDALATVRRAHFVPTESSNDVACDCAIPIGWSQTTSQPSLVALMIEALELTPQDTVLEIGTGRGYQTALLARLALRVVSVERIPELAQIARANLRGEGITNAQVVVADGTLGVPDSAPFDAIVVSAAFVRVPPPLVAQLTERARLVMPVGDDQTALVKVLEKRDDALVELMVLCGARFVPLLGVNGYEID